MRTLATAALGFLLGLAFCILPEAGADTGKPKQNIEVFCQGNGGGGFRKCTMDVKAPVNRIALEVLIDGQYRMDVQYWPDDDGRGLYRVKRAQ